MQTTHDPWWILRKFWVRQAWFWGHNKFYWWALQSVTIISLTGAINWTINEWCLRDILGNKRQHSGHKNDANEPDKVGQQNTDGMRHFYGAHVSFLLISYPVCTSQSTLWCQKRSHNKLVCENGMGHILGDILSDKQARFRSYKQTNKNNNKRMLMNETFLWLC